MQIEKWVCEECTLPCHVEISYSDEKVPSHIQGTDRFRQTDCLCKESRPPNWRKISSDRTWRDVVVECERLLDCKDDDTANSPRDSSLANLIRDLKSENNDLKEKEKIK